MKMWARFAKAVFNGEYKLSGWTWAGVIGAVIYTISPVDLFSELFAPLVGYVDDLGFWGVVAMLVAREKARWEETFTAAAIDVTPSKAS